MLYDSFKLKFKNMQLMCTEESKNVDFHNHTEFEILLFTEGNPEVIVGDKSYTVKKGDFIFVNPMEVHSITVSDKPYSLKCICFNPSIINDKAIAENLKNGTVYINNYIDSTTYAATYLKKLFLNISEAYEAADEWSDAEISSYITLMYIYLLKNNYISKNEPYSKSSAFCSDVLKYITAHYSESITSGDISKALSYSQEYFCRKFQRNFGRSFSDYLTMYRVSMSKIFLEDKNNTVSNVAYNCGFSSADYFSKCFKKIVGILPSEYKKNRKLTKKITMKKIALIGDSIRQIGYGTRVPELLGKDYMVFQPEDNCRFSKYTLRGIMCEWAEGLKDCDVIHWNNGLWDTWNCGDGIFTSKEEYASNMLRIAKLLKQYSDKVIFATTTPVTEEKEDNNNDTIKEYNEFIVPKLQEEGILINDLHSLVYPNIDEYIRKDDNIHLTDKGIEACAEKVAHMIKLVLDN